MTVHVRFFASLRERLGIEDTQISLPAGATVVDVWREVLGAAELPANILVAINQDYAALDAPVRDGDEVAFFPPVTGG
jgi:molybdopterin synthase sulfur carrier subunit